MGIIKTYKERENSLLFSYLFLCGEHIINYGVKSKYKRRKTIFMSHCWNSTSFASANGCDCGTTFNGLSTTNNSNFYYGGSYLTSVFYRVVPVNSGTNTANNGNGCNCGCRCGGCNRCSTCGCGWNTSSYNQCGSTFGNCCRLYSQNRSGSGCCNQ